MIKEALQYITDLRAGAEKTEVIEICGKTYANRSLHRYGAADKAERLNVHSLSALLEYIKSKGIASKVDAIVPNPVMLVPYRTFQEVGQPASRFVFRVRDTGNEPHFCLIEAGNHLWRNEAIENIKEYLREGLSDLSWQKGKERTITIIG